MGSLVKEFHNSWKFITVVFPYVVFINAIYFPVNNINVEKRNRIYIVLMYFTI